VENEGIGGSRSGSDSGSSSGMMREDILVFFF